MDIDVKKIMKNAWRINKDANLCCLRIRVPGGHLPVKFLSLIENIAAKYGNGTLHITTRQGFEMPGIPCQYREEVNALIAPIIQELEVQRGVKIDKPEEGYPAAGTRNVCACIGSRVCQKSFFDTTALAWDIEKVIFPHDQHVKVAVSGCPNDCIKAYVNDLGIMGQIEPIYNSELCNGCQACVKICQKVASGALSLQNKKVVRDPKLCIGCGECIINCPTKAWTGGKNYYRIVTLGRTGKKNPRIAREFVKWVDREAVLKMCDNLYNFIENHIDRSLPKERVGAIVDRVGMPVFKEEVLAGVTLPPQAVVIE